MNNPLIIIPTYIVKQKHGEILTQCLSTCRESTDAEIYVIDDGSPTGAEDYLAKAKQELDRFTYAIKEENTGFSSTVNIGLARALNEGRDAVLVNADIEFKEYGWLEKMDESDADIVGGLLLYPNYLIQHAGIYFSKITRNFSHRFSGCPPTLPAAQHEEYCPVTGALQFIRHSVLQDVGVYDEDFKLGFEDVDYMIRAIAAGHRSLYNPEVKAVHHESLFRGEKSDKIRQWETDSLVTLLTKYEDYDFEGIAPVEVR